MATSYGSRNILANSAAARIGSVNSAEHFLRLMCNKVSGDGRPIELDDSNVMEILDEMFNKNVIGSLVKTMIVDGDSIVDSSLNVICKISHAPFLTEHLQDIGERKVTHADFVEKYLYPMEYKHKQIVDTIEIDGRTMQTLISLADQYLKATRQVALGLEQRAVNGVVQKLGREVLAIPFGNIKGSEFAVKCADSDAKLALKASRAALQLISEASLSAPLAKAVVNFKSQIIEKSMKGDRDTSRLAVVKNRNLLLDVLDDAVRNNATMVAGMGTNPRKMLVDLMKLSYDTQECVMDDGIEGSQNFNPKLRRGRGLTDIPVHGNSVVMYNDGKNVTEFMVSGEMNVSKEWCDVLAASAPNGFLMRGIKVTKTPIEIFKRTGITKCNASDTVLASGEQPDLDSLSDIGINALVDLTVARDPEIGRVVLEAAEASRRADKSGPEKKEVENVYESRSLVSFFLDENNHACIIYPYSEVKAMRGGRMKDCVRTVSHAAIGDEVWASMQREPGFAGAQLSDYSAEASARLKENMYRKPLMAKDLTVGRNSKAHQFANSALKVAYLNLYHFYPRLLAHDINSDLDTALNMRNANAEAEVIRSEFTGQLDFDSKLEYYYENSRKDYVITIPSPHPFGEFIADGENKVAMPAYRFTFLDVPIAEQKLEAHKLFAAKVVGNPDAEKYKDFYAAVNKLRGEADTFITEHGKSEYDNVESADELERVFLKTRTKEDDPKVWKDEANTILKTAEGFIRSFCNENTSKVFMVPFDPANEEYVLYYLLPLILDNAYSFLGEVAVKGERTWISEVRRGIIDKTAVNMRRVVRRCNLQHLTAKGYTGSENPLLLLAMITSMMRKTTPYAMNYCIQANEHMPISAEFYRANDAVNSSVIFCQPGAASLIKTGGADRAIRSENQALTIKRVNHVQVASRMSAGIGVKAHLIFASQEGTKNCTVGNKGEVVVGMDWLTTSQHRTLEQLINAVDKKAFGVGGPQEEAVDKIVRAEVKAYLADYLKPEVDIVMKRERELASLPPEANTYDAYIAMLRPPRTLKSTASPYLGKYRYSAIPENYGSASTPASLYIQFSCMELEKSENPYASGFGSLYSKIYMPNMTKFRNATGGEIMLKTFNVQPTRVRTLMGSVMRDAYDFGGIPVNPIQGEAEYQYNRAIIKDIGIPNHTQPRLADAPTPSIKRFIQMKDEMTLMGVSYPMTQYSGVASAIKDKYRKEPDREVYVDSRGNYFLRSTLNRGGDDGLFL